MYSRGQVYENPKLMEAESVIPKPATGRVAEQLGKLVFDLLKERRKAEREQRARQADSPPVSPPKRDPTRVCDTCMKVHPKKQFDTDHWARPHSRCKACVQKAVSDMDAEQRQNYPDESSAMAEAIRLSQDAYAQINKPVPVDDAATEMCPICLEDTPIVELVKPWRCHGFCRDCRSETFAKFRTSNMDLQLPYMPQVQVQCSVNAVRSGV